MKNKLQLIIILAIASAFLLLANNFLDFTGHAVNLDSGDYSTTIAALIIALAVLGAIAIYKTKK